jgi:hypothetical protein
MGTRVNRLQIGVIGAGTCSTKAAALAYEVGSLLARNNVVLVCGGLGGVMEAACHGARDAGGTTVGILPGFDAADANPYVDIALPTGLSHARNILIVRASMALIAIEGLYGTLSEIAIALKLGKPVIGLHTWNISNDIVQAASAPEAVTQALLKIKHRA